MSGIDSRVLPVCVLPIAMLLGATAVCASSNLSQDEVLEIWINGVSANVVTTVSRRDGQTWVARSDLLDAGINPNQMSSADAKFISVAKLGGVTVSIDEPNQRLVLDAPPESLVPHVVSLRRNLPALDTTASNGLIASYQIATTTSDFGDMADASGVQAAFGMTYFGPVGTLTSTAISQADSSDARAVRLDTVAEWDEPDVPRRWLFGDAISGGLSWSRPVRFAGFQVATDFSLRPEFPTAPLPAFFGQAALPSSVDVLVNSTRVFEGNFDPGPFEIRDLPVLTGSGQATVVVRNILGQETTQTISFYTTDALLEEGLSAYDFDLGFVRRDYGEKSFAYGEPLAAGTYRYGLTNWLTVEAHSEIARNVQAGGGGGALTVGSFGAIGADAAISNSTIGQGALFSAFFESQPRPLSLFGSVSTTVNHYADLACIESSPIPHLSTELGLGLGLDRNGSLAVSWIETRDEISATANLLTASYTLSFGQGWYLGATGLHDFGNRAWAAQLTLSIPVEHDATTSISAESDHHSAGFEGRFTRPANPDGGWGYNFSAGSGQFESASGETTWVGDRGTVDAAISSLNGQTAGRLTVAGGIVAMNGAAFLTRVPDGAVALVETGRPDIPVYLENRQVATSDADGRALVTGLAPNAPNQISVEPTDYSFATVMGKTEEMVAPLRQTGVLVNLAPVRSRPALVTLEREDGTPPPVGSEVVPSSGGAPLVVGHGGQVFFADLEDAVAATVSWTDGACRFKLDPVMSAGEEAIAAIGPVRCRTSAAGQP